MELVWFIVIGFVAGLVAKMLTPGSGSRDFFLTSALGIVGSLAATFLGRFTGLYAAGQSAGLVGAVIGATVPLVAYHVVVRE